MSNSSYVENVYDVGTIHFVAEDVINNNQKNSTIFGNRHTSKYHKKVIKKTYDIINIGPHNKVIATKPGIGKHRTMGIAKEPFQNPCAFLRKNEGIKWTRKKEKIGGKAPYIMPPVPKRSELPKFIPKIQNKDMIKFNIENVKNCRVRQPKPKYNFTRDGSNHELCNSGIMPAYIFAPTFGKIPNYISKYNKITCEKQMACEEEHKKTVIRDDSRNLLSQNERIQILEGLKKCWLEMHLAFQTLPVFTDTLMKIGTKKNLENKLQQIEKDIVLLENNPIIVICD